MNIELELFELIQDTLQYLKSLEDPTTIEKPPLPKATLPETSLPKAPLPEAILRKAPPPKAKTPLPQKKSPSSWQLEPMISQEVPIHLLLPKKDADHHPFVEKVSKAITEHIAKSIVVSEEKPCKLLIAPLSFLKTKNPHLQPHKLHIAEGTSLFALEELDRYSNNPNLKRSLWNALKNMPLSF